MAALEGGLDVLKMSHEELLREGRTASAGTEDVIDAMRRLRTAGAAAVVVSRAEDSTLALVDDEVVEVDAPRLEAVDHRGGGDSLTAGITAGLARGVHLVEALRVGAAAGALNVTRRGLASGSRTAIEQVADHVTTQTVHH